MSRRDPLFPNALIVARREYRDRTRSRLYIGSTVVLALMAMLVAVAPIAVRALDRQTVTRIAIVAADADLGQRAVSVADCCSTTRLRGRRQRHGRRRSSSRSPTPDRLRQTSRTGSLAASCSSRGDPTVRSISSSGRRRDRTARAGRS